MKRRLDGYSAALSRKASLASNQQWRSGVFQVITPNEFCLNFGGDDLTQISVNSVPLSRSQHGNRSTVTRRYRKSLRCSEAPFSELMKPRPERGADGAYRTNARRESRRLGRGARFRPFGRPRPRRPVNTYFGPIASQTYPDGNVVYSPDIAGTPTRGGRTLVGALTRVVQSVSEGAVCRSSLGYEPSDRENETRPGRRPHGDR